MRQPFVRGIALLHYANTYAITGCCVSRFFRLYSTVGEVWLPAFSDATVVPFSGNSKLSEFGPERVRLGAEATALGVGRT